MKLTELKNKIIDYLSFECALKEIFKDIKSKEPKITTKKSGFNLDKTDLTENDSNKLFSAKGALNLLNTLTTNFTNAVNSAKEALRTDISRKEDKFTKNSGFNKAKTDTPENDTNKIFTALGALNLKKIIDGKPNSNGTYPNMTVGNSNKVGGKTFNWDWGNATPTHIWGSKGSATEMYVFNSDNLRTFINAYSKQEIDNNFFNDNNCPILKNAQGYTKLKNGLIIQWGQINNPPRWANNVCNLPVAFSTTNYKIFGHEITTSSSYWTGKNSCARILNQSQFSFGSWDGGGSFHYFAIGY